MSKTEFEIEPYSRADKCIVIIGLSGRNLVRMEVDFDDVDHACVARNVETIVKLLNTFWDSRSTE